ncbi:MAG: hypothetical protein RBU37_14560 [Myxococcota bacterium]|jgi:TPR repeat protein|nr:hypothetical protein [Myxococcota bacterium]
MCNVGDAIACREVGAAYAAGSKGLKRSQSKAVAFYKLACNRGDQEGCSLLDKLGESTTSVRSGGIEGLEKACQSGDGSACAKAAAAYEEGSGTNKDGDKAKALRQKACELGVAESCRK